MSGHHPLSFTVEGLKRTIGDLRRDIDDLRRRGDWQYDDDAELGEFLFPDWTPYTPTWSTSSAQPSIGNGVLGGYYLVVGRLMFLNVFVELGSTSTGGSGYWQFGLPSGWTVADPVGGLGARQIIPGIIERPSAVIRCPAVGKVLSGASAIDRVGYPRADTATGQPSVGGTVDASNPFTWTTGDTLALSGAFNVSAV